MRNIVGFILLFVVIGCQNQPLIDKEIEVSSKDGKLKYRLYGKVETYPQFIISGSALEKELVDKTPANVQMNLTISKIIDTHQMIGETNGKCYLVHSDFIIPEWVLSSPIIIDGVAQRVESSLSNWNCQSTWSSIYLKANSIMIKKEKN